MDKARYIEISERNKQNKLLLCYEVFCEEKGKIPFEEFQVNLPNWIMLQQPDVFVMVGGDLNSCTEMGLNKIVKSLDKKYE